MKHELLDAGIEPREVVDHQGAIGPLTPAEPGAYKYGIRLEDAETGEKMSDDDPNLIVESE